MALLIATIHTMIVAIAKIVNGEEDPKIIFFLSGEDGITISEFLDNIRIGGVIINSIPILFLFFLSNVVSIAQ